MRFIVKESIFGKIQKYKRLTKQALEKISLKKGLSKKDQKTAKDFLEMGKNYFFDAKYFEKKGDHANALAALSYAHAWLDAGVRAGLFDAKGDSKLFTLP